SISFSVPRCSRPICGSTRVTTSPSSSRTRRSTPWAAGCCGPKLMVNGRTSASAVVARLIVPPAVRNNMALSVQSYCLNPSDTDVLAFRLQCLLRLSDRLRQDLLHHDFNHLRHPPDHLRCLLQNGTADVG